MSGNVATLEGGGICNFSFMTVQGSSVITGNFAPLGFGPDVYSLGVLSLDSGSTITILDGLPPV